MDQVLSGALPVGGKGQQDRLACVAVVAVVEVDGNGLVGGREPRLPGRGDVAGRSQKDILQLDPGHHLKPQAASWIAIALRVFQTNTSATP